VANRAFEASRPRSRRFALRDALDREAVGALALAAAIPFLFLHEKYQPDFQLSLSSTTVDLRLSDAAVLLVVVAAALATRRIGLTPLRAARGLWLTGAVLLAWLAFETLRPASLDDDLFSDHLVTALKLGEYSLLALAVPLLVRRVQDLTVLLSALVLWGGLATAVAVAQFFGLDVFDAWNAGWRQPSFLGHHDFAALSSVGTSLACAAIVAGRRAPPVGRRTVLLGLAAGVIGLVIAGSVTAAAGLAAAAVAVAVASRARFSPSGKQLLALAAIVIAVGGGVAAVRGDSLADFMRFLGVRGNEAPRGVESYSQRTVLAYIGFRIFEDHPVIGVGWERSSRPDVFAPYLADAHKRFPDVVDLAFPSAEHPWGVQNLYIQMLADAGVIGFVLLLAVGVMGVVLAWRTTAYASTPWATGAGLVALAGLLTVAGVWASLGIVAGIPLQAALCLLLGLAAAGAAAVEDETSG
jgi:O-antigen ligase